MEQLAEHATRKQPVKQNTAQRDRRAPSSLKPNFTLQRGNVCLAERDGTFPRAFARRTVLPEFFKAVGAARFGVMAGVAAVLTAFFLYIAGAITEPPKTILFSGLESRDAAAVTAKLDGMTVKYDVKDGGTILVPADQVTKLRMALAQDNLPAAGVGYEIFDKSDAFGTTAFVQNINRLRALEGELARSIQTIEGIDKRPRASGHSRAPDLCPRRPDARPPRWC